MSSLSDQLSSSNGTRHCALCLKEISGEELQMCGKCNRRVYCSSECQQQDWVRNDTNCQIGQGQGHKNWCGITCGEEDIDWKVTPIAEKGLGLVALRDLPVWSRIIVEGPAKNTHPGIADLAPLNGTLEDKFYTNNLTYTIENDESAKEVAVVCLRISRVNHSCRPNATYTFDRSCEVVILYALRNIKKDEEICISYLPPCERFGEKEKGDSTRKLIADCWGIVCNELCVCFNYDAAIQEKFTHAMKLLQRLDQVYKRREVHEALELIKRLLELGDELDTGIWKRKALFNGFRCGIATMETLQLGMDYLAEAYKIAKLIHHPEKGETVNYLKKFVENPKLHRNYLALVNGPSD